MKSIPQSPSLGGPVEDYLKAIYELEASGGPAGTNEIAAVLRIAAPSVSGMLRRLARQRLVTHEPYKGVQLTREGRRAAPPLHRNCFEREREVAGGLESMAWILF